jgi:methyl-accepting chemotaxis protein
MAGSGSRRGGPPPPPPRGVGGGGSGAPGGRNSWVQNFVREWIAPSALAAVVIAVLGWFLADKFDAINKQIEEVRKVTDNLDQGLSSTESANLAVNRLLHTESKDLVDRINNTATTVNAISGDFKLLTQKIDGLVDDMKGLQSNVGLLTPLPETMKKIDDRTTRIENIMMRAPWVPK